MLVRFWGHPDCQGSGLRYTGAYSVLRTAIPNAWPGTLRRLTAQSLRGDPVAHSTTPRVQSFVTGKVRRPLAGGRVLSRYGEVHRGAGGAVYNVVSITDRNVQAPEQEEALEPETEARQPARGARARPSLGVPSAAEQRERRPSSSSSSSPKNMC